MLQHCYLVRFYKVISLTQTGMRIIIVLFFFITPCLLKAQLTQTVRGRITDKITSQPVPDVNIFLSDSTRNKGTATDNEGYYILRNVPVGRNHFVFSSVGYDEVVIPNVLVTSGKEIVLDVQMNEKINEIEQIIVRGVTRGEALNKMATVSTRSFTVEDAEKYAGTWNDLARMASNFAGVVANADDTRNDIIIRGNSPNGLLWRLEGIDIPNPNHFGVQGSAGGPISMLNTNQLTRSDFFTGAFPARYGNALSGVFDLNMRSGNSWKHEYLLQMAFNGFEAGMEGPFSKNYNGSYIINYRYSFLTLAQKILSRTPVKIFESVVPAYSDLSFKIYLPSRIGTFTLFGLGGTNEMKTTDDSFYNQAYPEYITKLRFESEMGVAALIHRINLGKNAELRTSAAVSGVNSLIGLYSMKESELNKLLFMSHIQEPQLLLSSSLSLKISPKNSFSAGVSLKNKMLTQHDSVSYAQSYFRVTNLDDKRIGLLQAYAEWQHKFAGNMQGYLGVHSQYLNFNRTSTLEPRLGFRWNFRHDQNINLGYGIHSQMQNLQFYFNQTANSDRTVYWKTSEKLRFTKSQHIVFGYGNQLTDDLKLKIETYYQYLWDVPVEKITSSFSALNVGASFYNGTFTKDSLVNHGKGKNYGVDLTLEKYLFHRWYMLFTSSLFDSKYKPSDGIWKHTIFAANYASHLLVGSEFPVSKNTSFDFNCRMVLCGGIRLIYIDKQASLKKGYLIYDTTKDYSERTRDYWKLDARVSLRRNSKGSTQEFGIDVSNLTNRKNVLSEAFSAKTGKTSYSYQFGILPTGFFRITF
jgi:hypothetical protein